MLWEYVGWRDEGRVLRTPGVLVIRCDDGTANRGLGTGTVVQASGEVGTGRFVGEKRYDWCMEVFRQISGQTPFEVKR